MDNIIWFIIMIPISLLFTAFGIYAFIRKKPMWFWSGSTVNEDEITDIRAYNRANGIMWLCFSAVYWVSTVLGGFKTSLGGIVLVVGSVIACIALPVTYTRIYAKYKKQ